MHEEEIAAFIQPAYPLYLAKIGLWGLDPAKMQSLAMKAAEGMAAVVPDDCDGPGFRRDLCGLKLLSVPSTSMEPGLKEKTIFAVASYGRDRPQRGDVIVFTTQSEGGGPQTFVKRLIGLPGDKVELRGGKVAVNGQTFATVPTSGTMTDISGATAKIYEEALPGGPHYLIGMNDRPIAGMDDAGPFKVPTDRYFVLGDNRHNSVDSRFPDQFGDNGFVPADTVSGHAVTIIASPDADRVGAILR